jgi:acyl-CoA thioesterase 8
MHCYFVLAGNAEIPIMYHVEKVRDGRSFATRTVQARQRGRPIFTTTMSFVRENSGGSERVEHAVDMPAVPGPSEDLDIPQQDNSPFQSQRIHILNHESGRPQDKKTRQWIKARGKISPSGGHQAHLSALAYMSDSYFIGTVSRVHRLWRFSTSDKDGKSTIDNSVLEKLRDMDDDTLRRMQGMDEDVIIALRNMKDINSVEQRRPEVGMMVSLQVGMFTGLETDGWRRSAWIIPSTSTRRATSVQMSGCLRRWKVRGREMAEDWYCRGKGMDERRRCSKQKLKEAQNVHKGGRTGCNVCARGT